MQRSHLIAVCLIVVGTFAMWATPAFAYLGPGAGLSAIGAFIALIIGVILAFAGFVWYPMKRLMGRGKTRSVSRSEPRQQPGADSAEEGV